MDSLETGYSAAASAVGKIFVERSQHALLSDPQLTINELVEETGLPEEDIEDAIYELEGRGMVQREINDILPKRELFVEFDEYWKPWNPKVDARRIAADLVNDDQFPGALPEISRRYDWEPRRLNPAVVYLMNYKIVFYRTGNTSLPFIVPSIMKNKETRLFVRNRL